ncbi:hypothetical protein [Paenibacillus illinoisensis]|uniref:hypothetical protein n=1 Tax=Paenibacillus illinoisensis TaxID=59845 RepID=UPI00301B6F30
MNVTNPLQVTIRIKASDDPIDLKALEESGGKYLPLKYPKFGFLSEAHRIEYNRIRRRLRGGGEEK